MKDASETETIETVVQSRSDLNKKSYAKLQVHRFNQASKVMRGVKGLLICWFIAVLCVLVPILHFVLVPAFFFLGIFMFFQQMSLRLYLEEGTIVCPSCNTNLKVDTGPFDWPKREICPNCRADLFIKVVTTL